MTTTIGMQAQKEISQSYRQLMTAEMGEMASLAYLIPSTQPSKHTYTSGTIQNQQGLVIHLCIHICNNNRKRQWI